MRLLVQIRDNDIEQSIAIHVGHIRSHSSQRPSFGADRGAGPKANFVENPLALVVKQEVGDGVIGNVNVRPSIVVIVSEDNAEAVSVSSIDAGLLADVRERAVGVVTVQDVGKTLVDVGMTVGANVHTGSAILIVVDGEVHVVRDKEIHVTIVIDVGKGTTRAPESGTPGVRPGSDVQKRTAPIVSVEFVGTDTSDIKIGPPIVVVIGGAGSHSEIPHRNA